MVFVNVAFEKDVCACANQRAQAAHCRGIRTWQQITFSKKILEETKSEIPEVDCVYKQYLSAITGYQLSGFAWLGYYIFNIVEALGSIVSCLDRVFLHNYLVVRFSYFVS
jgi:hypothetical protein